MGFCTLLQQSRAVMPSSSSLLLGTFVLLPTFIPFVPAAADYQKHMFHTDTHMFDNVSINTCTNANLSCTLCQVLLTVRQPLLWLICAEWASAPFVVLMDLDFNDIKLEDTPKKSATSARRAEGQGGDHGR